MVIDYTVRVEEDGDGYKVVIRKKYGSQLIGTPIRGVTKAKAESMAETIGFAFEYGTRAAAAEMSDLIWNKVK